MTARRKKGGYWLISCIFAVSALWIYYIFAGSALSHEGALYAALIFTGRIASCLILMTYVIRPLTTTSRGQLVRWLFFNRRLIGVSGGILLYIHLLILFYYIQISVPDAFVVFLVIGLPGLALLTAMLVTSNDYFQKKMGRNWRRLHLTGQWVLWFVMFSIYTKGFIDHKDWPSASLAVLFFACFLWRLSVDIQHLVPKVVMRTRPRPNAKAQKKEI